MEIRRLRYFLRIAEDGSLTRSAGVLRIAQSALTRQMRLLEQDLGVKLFVRSSRGMALTEDGEQLRTSVAAPLRELELALDAIRRQGPQARSTVVIGLPPGLADMLGLTLALELERRVPDIAVRMVEGPTGSLVDWLNRGVVDLALLEDSARDGRIEERLLHEERLWLIGPVDAPFNGTVRFEDAAPLPLIVPSHHLGIGGAIEDAAAARGLALNVRMHVDAARLARDLVEKGAGYAILPHGYCRDAIAQGRFQGWELVEPELMVGIHLAFRRHRRARKGDFDRLQDAVTAIASERFLK
ncbi:DNA-binding transcriptional LysR family regulator [Novosphingobium sp. PhB165]|uniref:LysR family transcriptional regulator n=1 Tax=Novosphingobium sp. PhB165 TaxID=2485105 RepID=UPI0010F0C942|nr:LysR family transcriptional regulator [Novosphingobium sp. PhB165]TCM20842.1 DNA-binding transcriptional LysR family regulator [Novosphingobium sp. PhB165]